MTGVARLLLVMAGLAWGVATAMQVAVDQTSPPATDIEGDWLVQTRDAIIRIERHGDQFEGRIVWQLHDRYGPEDGSERSGKIVTDMNNPDPAQRSQPLTGLRMLWGLRYDVERKAWVDGRVYNPDSGKTYHCLVRLPEHDRLILRGYIGVSLLGGNTTWTRTHEPFPASASAATTVNWRDSLVMVSDQGTTRRRSSLLASGIRVANSLRRPHM
ncbi:DUF2147 domain-containing protein [Dyella solisilvae]|uniref:DUF2147 domain-containing protein n=1 Tax=Dyella solisilvae TaxID=1920168 RepID=UPI0013149EE6|nr:DUF2147 domain-containing protein [Dyella solisilvae]